MNRTLVVATVLASGLATSSLFAQDAAPAAAPAAPATAPAAVAPQAVPAKIAVIDLVGTSASTNEGAKTLGDLRKKYDPRQTELQTRAGEVESLKKQLNALPANAPDDQRAPLIKSIDTKERKLQSDAQELQQEEGQDFNEAIGKLIQKVGPVALKYATDNGFTMLLNKGENQQGELPTLIWWNPSSDISQAVVNAYNAQSGVAAPTPSAPRPHTTTTHPATSTTPKK